MKYILVLLCLVAQLSFGAEVSRDNPIHIITAFPVGSGPDSMLRVLGNVLAEKLKQPVVVENKPGGRGFVAVSALKQSRQITLVQLDNFHLLERDPYSISETVIPVIGLFKNPFFVVVSSNGGYKTITDIVKKSSNYGSWSVGSPGHIGALMLTERANVSMNHIPFKEMTQLYSSVAVGDVEWAFGSAGSTQALYNAGKLKYVAVSSDKRLKDFPDVPTVAELGYTGFELYSWVGLYVVSGTDATVVKQLNADIASAIADPTVQKQLASLHYDLLPKDIEYVQNQVAKNGKIYNRYSLTNYVK